MEITITIPDDEAAEILKDYAAFHGYRKRIPSPVEDPESGNREMIDNPEAVEDFAGRMIVNTLLVQAGAEAERREREDFDKKAATKRGEKMQAMQKKASAKIKKAK